MEFASEKQGSNANKLEILSGNILLLEEPIDKIDGDKYGLFLELELVADFDEPID